MADSGTIKLFNLVASQDLRQGWGLGRVIGMTRFDLSIGPILIIRDLNSWKKVTALSQSVDKLVRATVTSTIFLRKLVVPTGESSWGLGHVIGLDYFHLDISPQLRIRVIPTGEQVFAFPMHVTRLERA